MTEQAVMKEKVDRLAELNRQMSVIKGETEQIKAWFEKQAVDDLRDTKNKTVEYWGNGNAKVVVGNSETVKPVSMSLRNRPWMTCVIQRIRPSNTGGMETRRW